MTFSKVCESKLRDLAQR